MAALKGKIAGKTREYNALYRRYAPQFEREHLGEYVALAPGFEPIFGTQEETLLEEAIKRFGRGDFAFWHIGDVGRWRSQRH